MFNSYLLLSVFIFPVAPGSSDDYSSIVETLQFARKANEGRFSQGSMKVVIHRGNVDVRDREHTLHSQITANVKWLGDTVHSDLILLSGPTRDFNTSNYIPLQSKIIYQKQPSKLTKLFYLHDHPYRIFIESLGRVQVERDYNLTPHDFWYNAQILEQISAIDLFDKSRIKPSDIKKAQFTYTQDGDVVHLVRAEESNRCEAWFDLSLDGNLVKFSLNEPGNFKTQGELQWKRNKNNDLYLKSASSQLETTREGVTGASYEDVEVTDFDSRTKILPRELSMSSWQISDVIVEDEIKHKIYRIGEASSNAFDGKWEQLIRAMKSSGFALPDRK